MGTFIMGLTPSRGFTAFRKIINWHGCMPTAFVCTEVTQVELVESAGC